MCKKRVMSGKTWEFYTKDIMPESSWDGGLAYLSPGKETRVGRVGEDIVSSTTLGNSSPIALVFTGVNDGGT